MSSLFPPPPVPTLYVEVSASANAHFPGPVAQSAVSSTSPEPSPCMIPLAGSITASAVHAAMYVRVCRCRPVKRGATVSERADEACACRGVCRAARVLPSSSFFPLLLLRVQYVACRHPAPSNSSANSRSLRPRSLCSRNSTSSSSALAGAESRGAGNESGGRRGRDDETGGKCNM